MIASDLTKSQLLMLIASGFDERDGAGFGVELRGSGEWSTARSLQRLKLGWIEGGMPNGSEMPGLFFANANGVAITHGTETEAFISKNGRGRS